MREGYKEVCTLFIYEINKWYERGICTELDYVLDKAEEDLRNKTELHMTEICETIHRSVKENIENGSAIPKQFEEMEKYCSEILDVEYPSSCYFD